MAGLGIDELLAVACLPSQREIWRLQFALAKIRKAARELLTLDPKDKIRLFEGPALLRRMIRYGLLSEDEKELDFVLQLSTKRLLERRLQYLVWKMGYAHTIHEARVLIRQRHIRVGKQMVNIPGFLVRTDSAKLIEYSLTSPLGQGRPGRVARKRAAQKAAKGGDEE
eukprot:scaffold447_cov307-Pinguiococcus_pyrenoidosus.AAC.64